ncbi:hypothetical protein [Streptomyces cinnamoneus]|uniref:hypothetical protein n=1 Tax=Streptomyces cinnamoneus TaxID=53446 RepID=UPI0037A42FC7
MGSGTPDLNAPSESLEDFKKRVDRLLEKLDGSAASHTKIADQKVKGSAYGNFPEARALASAYDTVHAQLEVLSRALGDRLAAMGIAVSAANKGYRHVDGEQARQLAAIQKRGDEYWEQQKKWGDNLTKKPKAEPQDKGGGAEHQDKGGASSGGTTAD